MHGHHRFYLRNKLYKPREPKKIIKALALVFFISEFGIWFIRPFISIYINSVVDNLALTGLLFSALTILPIILDIPIGDFIDLIGRKIVTGTGFLIFSLSGFLFFLASEFNLLFLARMLQGLGISFSWDPAWVITRDESPKGKEAKSISWFIMGPIIASIIAPILGGVFVFIFNIRLNFLVFSLATVVAFFVFVKIMPETLEHKESVKQGFEDLRREKIFSKPFKDARILHPNIWVSFVLVFLFGLALQGIPLILPLFSESLDAGFIVLGGLFSLMALPGLLQGHISELGDKISEEKVIILMAILGIIASIGFMFTNNIIMLFPFSLLLAFTIFGLNPNIHALLTKYTPHSEEGELTGVHQTFKHVGFLVGPLIMGFLSEMFGLSLSFTFFVLVFVLIILFSFVSLKLGSS